jgi:hypothetical protein
LLNYLLFNIAGPSNTAGDRQVIFDDTPAKVVHTIAACMHVAQENQWAVDEMKLFHGLDLEHVLQIIDFSIRVLMPWIGTACAQAAVKSACDADLLLGLLTKKSKFVETDEADNWIEIEEIALSKLGGCLDKALQSPRFAKISLDQIHEIFDHVTDIQSEEVTFEIPCTSNKVSLQSLRNSHGFFMELADAKIGRNQIPSKGHHGGSFPHTLKIGSLPTARATWALTRESNGEYVHKKEAWPCAFGNTGVSLEIPSDSAHSDDAHFKVSFKTVLRRNHLQCAALMCFYASSQGINLQNATVEDTWRYFEESGEKYSAGFLREYLGRFFSVLHNRMPGFYGTLTCMELESIISFAELNVGSTEKRVLQVVIDWAKNKSMRVNRFNIGDMVRLRPAYTQAVSSNGCDDCVVDAIHDSPPCLLLRKLGVSIKVELGHVYDPAETAMMRLLPHVRCGFLPIKDLRTTLNEESIIFASKISCYRHMVKTMVELAVGTRSLSSLGVQGTPRSKSKQFDAQDNIDALTHALIYGHGDGHSECDEDNCTYMQSTSVNNNASSSSSNTRVHSNNSSGAGSSRDEPKDGRLTGKRKRTLVQDWSDEELAPVRRSTRLNLSV